MTDIYTGYSAYVWEAVYAGMDYFNVQLLNVSSVSGTAQNLSLLSSQAEGIYSSLRNGVIAVDAYAMTQAWASEINSLQAIQGLPLVLDAGTIAIFNNRVAAYGQALVGVTAITPLSTNFLPAEVIDSATSIIPAVGLITYLSTFNVEPAPPGTTSATLVTNAYAVATAMLNVANAISIYQGANVTQLYDVAYRQYQCALSIANMMNSFTSGAFAANIALVKSWNQMVTVPTMLLCSDVLNGAGYSFQLQQQAVLRYAMLSVADKVSNLLLSLRQPLTSRVNLTTLRVNETLFDVAARALGDYELWPDIAILNGLTPPYVGPVSSPGIAGWGTQLVLPTPGTDVSAIGTLPNYNTNFLGNDLYIGPINGAMPAWAGDFQIIGGYSNLQWALGRRVQTTLGNLKYHPSYGCRIPPEVGNIQSNTTIGHINAYGISALKSDPRVTSVKATTSTIQPNGAVQFASVVEPGGFQSTPVGINETIAPLP